MTVKNASWLARHLHRKKRVLILAGALCDQIEFEGKSLLDYVVEVAKKINAPVAATGNTVTGLRARGIDTGKAWAVEVVNFMRSDWQYPLIDGKPEVLVFMGYSPTLTANLASAVEDAESIALGSTYVETATYSLPDVKSFREWQEELTTLVQALGES